MTIPRSIPGSIPRFNPGNPRAALRQVSWFCHIEAARARFVVWVLMVSGDNGAGAAATASQIGIGGCKNTRFGTGGRMSVDREKRALALGALLLSALALGGCSISIADLPLVGTPADAPARAKETGAYLPVNALPPDRDEAAMDPAERARLQAELLAARDRQASVAASQNPAAK